MYDASMRLANFDSGGERRLGVAKGEEIVDLSSVDGIGTLRNAVI
jgi:hypothetical protein